MPRRNKVQSLTPELRAEIERLLIQRGFAGYAELEQQILDAHGVEIGKSTLHRYGSKLQRKLDAIRASTEAAKLIQQHAGDDKDARSEALTAMVQTELFEAILMLQEADEQGEDGEKIDHEKRVEVLSKAAKNIATLTRSSINLKEFQAKVEEAARRKLLEEQQAKAQELTRAGVPAQEVLAQVIRAGYGL